MKRFVSTFLAVTVLASSLLFVGCSSNEEGSSSESTSAESNSAEEKAEEKTEEKPEEKEEAEASYQYYTADETKAKIENKEDMYILDIQVEDEFNAHHIEGAVATYAYPVKSDEDKAKLDAVLPELEAGTEPILVVCPGGAGGATRTIDYLTEKGVAADRLFILENGQSKWPHDELLAK